MQTDISIRKAQSKDREGIEELLNSCDLPSEDLTVNHLQHFHLIEHKGQIRAVAGLEIYGSDGLLRSLAVDEQHRKKGWGKKLTERTEAYAREQELEGLYLLTTTADTFFKSLGYKKVDRSLLPEQIRQSSQFKDICPSTAIAMQKGLQ